MSRKVLIVEDDAETARFIANGLTEAGYLTEVVADGRDGLFHATDGEFDAIILDRMLPKLDGLAVLKAVRAAGVETPVIILSALSTPDERVKGLDGGSDDYLAKPFTFNELRARLEALLRRKSNGAAAVLTKLTCADLELDLMARKATRAGQPILLQPREFRLLEYLLRHKDQAVTRTMLLEGVWDYHFDPQTNVIDVHISRLRQKIDKSFDPPLLHTVRGAGYMLSALP